MFLVIEKHTILCNHSFYIVTPPAICNVWLACVMNVENGLGENEKAWMHSFQYRCREEKYREIIYES